MDTSAPEILFSEDGICGYCTGVKTHINQSWFPDLNGTSTMAKKFDSIKKELANRPFDSILGLSGGLDSTVVAFKAVEYGLKPLVLHIDAGWNTNESVSNVEKVCSYLDLELETIVINWEEMRRLQIAYLNCGVMNQDVPQDHALFSSFYKFASDKKFKYLLSGVNFATESVQPSSWGYTYTDGKQIKYIAKKFGNFKLRKYPILRIKDYKKISNNNYFDIVRPLDYGFYDPSKWQKDLINRIGWKPYWAKHGESVFTGFFQSIYLFEKFGIDKRRSDYSSLILSGNMTRESALRELSKPPIQPIERNRLLQIVASKLELSDAELNTFLLQEPRDHYSLPNDSKNLP
jgi:N-acetyl sugar amidotransferase